MTNAKFRALMLVAGPFLLSNFMPCRAVGALAGKFFWVDNSAHKIRRANLNGSNVQELITSGLNVPRGIAVDANGDRMYWTDQSNQTIQRARLDGSSIDNLITSGLSVPFGIALDLGSGKMYWSDFGLNRLSRASLDGASIDSLVTGLSTTYGIGLDLVNNRLYWAHEGQQRVQRCALDGSSIETLVTGLGSVAGVAVDPAGGKFYWTDYGTSKVHRANLDGNNIQALIDIESGQAQGIALDLSGAKVYYTIQGLGRLRRGNTDGTNVEELVTSDTGSPYGIAVVPESDCNSNGIGDGAEIAAGSGRDCNSNDVLDVCEIPAGSIAPGGPFFCTAGCNADCNSNGIPDSCDVDCNTNLIPDACDIRLGTSVDCNSNSIPDECDSDCNTNHVPDDCDIAQTTSADCDGNRQPDECQVGNGTRQWIGPDNGSFQVAANWSPTGVPSGAGQAIMTNSGASDNRCLLNTAGTSAVCSINISASGAGKQILRIAEGSVLLTHSQAIIQAGGEINLRGGQLAGGPVTNSGNSLVGYGLVSANVTNNGRVEGFIGESLTFSGAVFSNQATGTLRAPLGGVVHVESLSVVQTGDIDVRSGAVLGFDAALVNSAGGSIMLLGGSLGAAGLTNHATGELRGFGTIDTNVTNQGDVTAIADLQVVGNLTNQGTVTIQSGILTVTGTLSGSGTIIGGFGGRQANEAILAVGGDLDLTSRDWGQIELSSATVQMNGTWAEGLQTLEVLASDRGARGVALPGRALYSIGMLRLGPRPTTVRLADRHDNSRDADRRGTGERRESLYVGRLIIEPGVTLDLAGLHLYYGEIAPTDPFAPDSLVRVIDSIGGGSLTELEAKAEGVGQRLKRW